MKTYTYKSRGIRFIIGLIDTVGYLFKKVLFFLRKQNLRQINRILIFKLDHAGDVLLSIPAIRSIRNKLPLAYITLVVGPWAKGIVEGEGYIDEIICYKAYWQDRGINRSLNILDTLNLIWTLRRGNYDIFFDLRGDLFAIMIAFLSGVPRRVGYGWEGGGFLLTDEVETTTKKHQAEILMDGARTIAIDANTPNIVISTSENDERYVHEIMAAEGWDESCPTIGFHIGSGCPSKMWAVERYAELMERLVKHLEVQIVIIGGIDDLDIVQRLESLLGFKPINVVGRTTFKQTAVVIKKCAVFIGNDSVAVHIAAAVSVPTIVIFSAANDCRRWKPYGNDVTVVYKDVSCKECEKATCNSMECMNLITVDELFDLVLDKNKTQDNRI